VGAGSLDRYRIFAWIRRVFKGLRG